MRLEFEPLDLRLKENFSTAGSSVFNSSPVDHRHTFRAMLSGTAPILALAPMQEVTDWAFWRLMARYGGPDVYYTEYFRVYSQSRLDKTILRSVTENPTGKPAIAQLIGNDVAELVRTAKELQHYPVAAVDLNLGCPAPVVYRKCAGGGLLREPARVDAILGALRDALDVPFTVKTRIGFDSTDVFSELLPLFAKHSLDLLTVHGRTVKELYRSEVHHDFIRQAVEAVHCPVLANGNVYSASKAAEVLQRTGARGLMIGRGAIRNPWLFDQFRQARSGQPPFVPRGRDVLDYVRALYEETCHPEAREQSQVQHMKRFMNFLGLGVDAGGGFLHDIRRVNRRADFFAVCERFLDHGEPMPLEPFPLNLHERDVVGGAMR
ncbi:MAG: tRNA-dihydrouridine synthase family protein [Verrucomicrobia bacterium]|nr:tRNA-dihydrouridine synthase family protein [Verrucomicrobiota bacterium]